MNINDNVDNNDPVFVFIDARRFLVINKNAVLVPTTCYKTSKEKLLLVCNKECNRLSPHHRKNVNLVITGYVASNTEGVCTTLGRDGSD